MAPEEIASLHHKLDRVLFILEDDNVGVCHRVKNLEHTVNGNGKAGLSERVRILETADKAAANNSATAKASIVSLGVLAVWEFLKRKMGWG